MARRFAPCSERASRGRAQQSPQPHSGLARLGVTHPGLTHPGLTHYGLTHPGVTAVVVQQPPATSREGACGESVTRRDFCPREFVRPEMAYRPRATYHPPAGPFQGITLYRDDFRGWPLAEHTQGSWAAGSTWRPPGRRAWSAPEEGSRDAWRAGPHGHVGSQWREPAGLSTVQLRGAEVERGRERARRHRDQANAYIRDHHRGPPPAPLHQHHQQQQQHGRSSSSFAVAPRASSYETSYSAMTSPGSCPPLRGLPSPDAAGGGPRWTPPRGTQPARAAPQEQHFGYRKQDIQAAEGKQLPISPTGRKLRQETASHHQQHQQQQQTPQQKKRPPAKPAATRPLTIGAASTGPPLPRTPTEGRWRTPAATAGAGGSPGPVGRGGRRGGREGAAATRGSQETPPGDAAVEGQRQQGRARGQARGRRGTLGGAAKETRWGGSHEVKGGGAKEPRGGGAAEVRGGGAKEPRGGGAAEVKGGGAKEPRGGGAAEVKGGGAKEPRGGGAAEVKGGGAKEPRGVGGRDAGRVRGKGVAAPGSGGEAGDGARLAKGGGESDGARDGGAQAVAAKQRREGDAAPRVGKGAAETNNKLAEAKE
ncbi:uncharacterized protein LOC116956791 [Petromyzon marinus]|uniref:uncharacterized protein LOC116956791 n=1 Tax=Petromyzon marinus TaxID=7757 RepID=UPI003F70DA19